MRRLYDKLVILYLNHIVSFVSLPGELFIFSLASFKVRNISLGSTFSNDSTSSAGSLGKMRAKQKNFIYE